MGILTIKDNFTPTASEFKEIQPFLKDESITAENLFKIRKRACGNKMDSDFEAFTSKALKTIAKTLVDTPALIDHQFSSKNRWGKNYKTKIVKDSTQKGYWSNPDDPDYEGVEVDQYALRTDDNESFLDNMKAGIDDKASLGFMWGIDQLKCSVCGKGLYERDDNWNYLCSHIPGEKYDGKQCIGLYDDIKRAYELSNVPLGAQSDAGTIKGFGDNDERYNAKDYNTDSTVIDVKAWKSGLRQKCIQKKIKWLEENMNLEELNEKIKNLVTNEGLEEKVKSLTEGLNTEVVNQVTKLQADFEEIKKVDLNEAALVEVKKITDEMNTKLDGLNALLTELKTKQEEFETEQKALKEKVESASTTNVPDPSILLGKTLGIDDPALKNSLKSLIDNME